ncbi:MAG: HTTM domain-containing protein [Cyanobacteria bacterium REEB67]|nr:HTTM domain-containing protein [Cyanobacteria bacterium REEB67]
MSITEIWKAWDKFWFSETSPLTVAVYRVLFGLIVFLDLAMLTPDLYNFYGAHGWLSTQSVLNWTGVDGLSLFHLCPENDTFLTIVHVALLLTAASLMIGFKSRLCAFLLYLGINSYYHRDPFLLNSGDTYMRVSMFFLIFAASGRALSIDKWLADKKQKTDDPARPDFDNYRSVSIWPLRLLQLVLWSVYCHTFVRKFWGETWYDGTAVYYSSRVEDLQRFPLPFVFDQLWTINFLTYATLALELALFTLIWVKELRYWVIGAAIIFHLTIDYHMNIPFFEYLMIISYVLFAYPQDVAWVLRKARDYLHRPKKVKTKKVKVESKSAET